MRCAACDEGGLDTGTTQNRSSLGVLLVMRGGFDTGTTLNRSSLGVLLVMRGGFDTGTTLKPRGAACDEGRF